MYSSMNSKLSKNSFKEYLRYRVFSIVFSNKGWPEWLGGILLGLVNILFLVWASKPFSIYTGYLNWGQTIYWHIFRIDYFGLPKASPLFEKTSVGDIGLFIGAFLAAVLSNEFKIRLPNSRIDYIEAIIGGMLMALGVVFAKGCNWGGFFSAITALSLHGYLMFIGLLVGGFLGALYIGLRVRYEIKHMELVLEDQFKTSSKNRLRIQRITGSILMIVLFIAIISIMISSPDSGFYIGILLLGMLVGIVLQRSRFCFATAFRDVIQGKGEFKRSIRLQIGIALGILVGATGAFILKYQGFLDPMIYVKPSGLSNILGGILFGLGMVIAGGCASGSLWRAAEGHIKLWITLVASILLYPILKFLIETNMPWIFGPKISLIQLFGWTGSLVFIYITMFIWILFILYLEFRRWRIHG